MSSNSQLTSLQYFYHVHVFLDLLGAALYVAAAVPALTKLPTTVGLSYKLVLSGRCFVRCSVTSGGGYGCL